jgi:hypothetical protein
VNNVQLTLADSSGDVDDNLKAKFHTIQPPANAAVCIEPFPSPGAPKHHVSSRSVHLLIYMLVGLSFALGFAHFHGDDDAWLAFKVLRISQVISRFHSEKAGVEEMHYRVLRSTSIDIHRHPVSYFFRVERCLIIIWTAIA